MKNKSPLRIVATIPAGKIDAVDLPAVLAGVRFAIETMCGEIGPVVATPLGDGAMTSGAAAKQLGISVDLWAKIVKQRRLVPVRTEPIGASGRKLRYWSADVVRSIAQDRRAAPPSRGRPRKAKGQPPAA